PSLGHSRWTPGNCASMSASLMCISSKGKARWRLWTRRSFSFGGPMSATFWRQIHGGSTHFPIVLLLASVVFDFVAWRSRDKAMQRGLHTAAFGSAVVGMLGGIGAAIAGIIMTRGRMLGSGGEKLHHLFVWPAFAFCIVFVEILPATDPGGRRLYTHFEVSSHVPPEPAQSCLGGPLILVPPSQLMSAKRLTMPIVITKAKAQAATLRFMLCLALPRLAQL